MGPAALSFDLHRIMC